MRIELIRSACLVLAIGVYFVEPRKVVTAEPTSAAARKESSFPVEEPEIPAVPYVTLGLIRDAAVQAELGLDPQQSDKVRSAIAEVDESFWRLRDTPVAKCSEELNSLYARLRASLALDLSSAQLERLDQLVLQTRSWKGVARPDVADKLKLTTEQVKRLRSLLADVSRNREALEKSIATQPISRQQTTRAKQRKVESQKFADVLTVKQQDALSELLGKPFDFDRVTSVGVVAPELHDPTEWINSQPITLRELRGKVVVVHFWAFGCINCIRNLPHYQSWHEKYSKSDLTIIGIHTPETESERSLENLKRQVIERKIEYPVLFDADAKNWKAWGNDVWPSVYLIDKRGQVRNWWYGELNWKGATGEEFIRKRIEALMDEK